MTVQSPALQRRRRAVIVGGSMSGLFTAAFLRQIGWDADVYIFMTVICPIRLIRARRGGIGSRACMLPEARPRPGRRRAATACTNAIVHGDTAYAAWRDAG